MKLQILSALAMVLFASCVSMSPEARKVQVHGQVSTLLDSCKKLGPVQAEAKVGWSWESTQADAKIRLREEAFKLGGDSVVVLNTDKLSSSVLVQGVAFRCYEMKP